MALPSGTYAPRAPAASVLYQVVRDHYHTFRAEASRLRDGEGLPRFVDDEFDAFLRCGWLAGGFARFRCTGCHAERLVAFSCKGRGFCPSCGGRRMTERAAHLVDHVWPEVPVRQRVLTLPPRVRYALAWPGATTCAPQWPACCSARYSATCGRGPRRAGSGTHEAGPSSLCSASAGHSISTSTCTRSCSTGCLRAPGTAICGSTGRHRRAPRTWRTCWRHRAAGACAVRVGGLGR
jgi:hypothetical protein